MKELPENYKKWVEKCAGEDYKNARSKGLVTKDRWGEGVDHHPMSERLMSFLCDHDFVDYNDYFCWKKGGDGDNGEALMYQMDAFFELLDLDNRGENMINHQMKEEITIEQLKNIIIEEGGQVSPIIPLGPVAVIFTKCVVPTYDGDMGVSERYEKYAIEYASMPIKDGLEAFRKNVVGIINSSSKNTIFSLYQLLDVGDHQILRLGWINYFYAEQEELTIEDAKKIIDNPPKNVSPEYVQDLKTIYRL